MLHLILVEAALETVPLAIASHPAVRRNAKRRGKRPEEVLLDRSLHHRAMEGLPEGHKRGRPDIAHFCLLESLGSPLNRIGELRTWVHAYGGFSIEVSPEARLPRDCNRFNSLIEQLFSEGRVPPEGEGALMTSRPMGLADLIKEIEPTHTVALTSHGEASSLEEVCRALSVEETPAVLIGAFPHGPMSEETLSLADEAKSVYHEPLEAWVVTSRLIYEYEKSSGAKMKMAPSSRAAP
jgi:rRNA small subunit pseudouridine methyltransferase Nep1